jgi:hypothetical protein
MSPTPEPTLPEPDALRSRIEGLDTEADHLRKLLRLALRIKAGQAGNATSLTNAEGPDARLN